MKLTIGGVQRVSIKERKLSRVNMKSSTNKKHSKSVSASSNRRGLILGTTKYEYQNSTPALTVTQLVPSLVQDVYEKNDTDTSSREERYQKQKTGDQSAEYPNETKKFQWIHDPVSFSGRTYYEAVKFENNLYSKRDFIILKGKKIPTIGQIQYIYSGTCKVPIFHVRLFCHGSQTILENKANPYELFAVDSCDDFLEDKIGGIVKVTYRKLIDNSQENENYKKLPTNQQIEESYFCSRMYQEDFCRFTEFVEPEVILNSCSCCNKNQLKVTFETPVVYEGFVRWKGVDYKNGNTVFLEPDAYKFEYPVPLSTPPIQVDQNVYTEYYRFRLGHDNSVLSQRPYCIGLIENLSYLDPTRVTVKVRIFFRPENTKGSYLMYYEDIRIIYWSWIVITTSFENIRGKCFVKHLYDDYSSGELWSREGPDRFYFRDAYDDVKSEICEIPVIAYNVGKHIDAPNWSVLSKPLNCMEIYAGCGGLSNGFSEIGLSKTKWAIESNEAARRTFTLNNTDCNVFSDDCIAVFQRLFEVGPNALGLPKQGEVDILTAEPPSKNYLIRNPNVRGSESLNAEVATSLSYCEYYRPKYFILQNNVIDYIAFGEICKQTFANLLLMNYQVTGGIFQVGNYGVPYDEIRYVIIGAAPGYPLPKLPNPTTAFTPLAYQATQVKPFTGFARSRVFKLRNSAPLRACNILDAIGDLPTVTTIDPNASVPYDIPMDRSYQYMLRSLEDTITSHSSKQLNPQDLMRIALIPELPEADWRNLPNITQRSNDGIEYDVLKYRYRTHNQPPGDPPRGICACVINQECNVPSIIPSTTIPWYLSHTANRNNQWAGMYGRLNWYGYLRDQVNNKESIVFDGRIIHPSEDRVISVREVARCRGFSDEFVFCGTVNEQYQQLYKSIPPPFATVIGQQIANAICQQ